MKLSDLFDCTFIINLPDRKDRRKGILKELTKADMHLEPGKVEIYPAVRPKDAAGFPSPAVRGCYLSHLGALREARRRLARGVLIMEDDLSIAPLVTSQPEALSSALTQQWDIAYLGHREPVIQTPNLQLLPYSKPVITAHFYAVREPILGNLVEYLEKVLTRPPGDPMGGPMHLDGALTMFRHAHPDVLTRIAAPSLGDQRSSRSDIHSNWLQQSQVFRHVYSLGRYIRESLGLRGNPALATKIAATKTDKTIFPVF